METLSNPRRISIVVAIFIRNAVLGCATHHHVPQFMYSNTVRDVPELVPIAKKVRNLAVDKNSSQSWDSALEFSLNIAVKFMH